MTTDEMVDIAYRLATNAHPVGASDGGTYVVSPPTRNDIKRALEAVAPLIFAAGKNAGLEEAAGVADHSDYEVGHHGLDAEDEARIDERFKIADAIRALKEPT